MSGNLTAEQLRRIEENKKKALAKRAGKLQVSTGQSSSVPFQVTGFSKPQDRSKSYCGSTGTCVVNFPDKIQGESKSFSCSTTTCLTNNADKIKGEPFPLKRPENSISKAQNVTRNDTLSVTGISKSRITSTSSCTVSTDKFRDCSGVDSKNSATSVGYSGIMPKHCVNSNNTSEGTGSTLLTTSLPSNQFSSTSSVVKHSDGNSNAAVHSERSISGFTSSKTNIDYDKIEQNRLKALAKRAEKLNKSPSKGVNLPSNNRLCSNNSFGQSVGSCNKQDSLGNSDKQDSLGNSDKQVSFGSSDKQVSFGRSDKQQSVTSSDKHYGALQHSLVFNDMRQLQTHNTVNSVTNSSSSNVRGSVISSVQQSYRDGATSSGTSSDTSSGTSSGTSSDTSNISQNMFSRFTGTPVKGGCFLVSRERFEVVVGYSAPLIELFKVMKTKLYDAVSKKWSFKLSEYNSFMTAVRNLKPAVDIEPLPKAVLTVFGAQIKGDNSPKQITMADLSRVDQSLVNSLMSFQREGVNFGVYKNGRVLIADDMGLGKTIQAICLSCYYRTEWPLLVVVPSSVRFDWAQNFLRWVPSLDSQCVNVVVTGKENCTSGLINILSYDIMARKADVLKNKRFQVVIMDESHLLKNYKTARCKAASPILQNARRVFLLSGTPAMSRPSELYTQIDAVCPFLFKFHDFGVRYCAGTKLPWGWDYSGSSNMKELQILLEEKIMIRRLKKDVLTELPDKIRKMILLDPSLVKINKDLKTASTALASGKLKKIEEKGRLLDFFHKSGSAKMKAIKCYIEDLLECDTKFLIFAHHGDVLDGIEETVKAKNTSNYIRIDGKTNSEQRNFLCKKFQLNDDIRVAVLSITAANAGLNLSSACLVVFAELFWNPGILVQAEDRAHRIGQQDMVNVQYLVARGTSDDHIWPMIQKKLDVLGKAGLSKDNFSSAETTRLTDQRQEEITKFLEESFCDDVPAPLAECDSNVEDQDMNLSPKKALRQSSILKFTSPAKDMHSSSPCSTPPKEKKPKGLFKYFSPSKTCNDNIDQISGQSSDSVDLAQNIRQDAIAADDDIGKFLIDSGEWTEDDCEPAVKKRKT